MIYRHIFRRIMDTDSILWLRERIAKFRFAYCKGYRLKRKRYAHNIFMANLPYERGEPGLWYPPIMSIEQTLQMIKTTKCGCCRFGDGELDMISGIDMSFQGFDAVLQRRLIEIIENPIKNCICCIPNIFGTLSRFQESTQRFWRPIATDKRSLCQKLTEGRYSSSGMLLGDPHVSRPYLTMQDKKRAPYVFDLWKEIFAGRDIIVVEGRFSRIGIGNDLLSGAKKIQRIWCPPKDAFRQYKRIIEAVDRHATKNDLILIALGATATVLAYDLCRKGLQALDVGHIDLEYIWMKMNVREKVPIPGRYVNECKNGHEMIPIQGEEIANNVLEVII